MLSPADSHLRIDCGLGEGPHWEEASNTLRFVDIVKRKVPTVDLNKGSSSHHVLTDLDIFISVTADIEGTDKEFAFDGKHGYGIVDRETGKYKYIRRYWEGEADAAKKEQELRGNDGGVNRRGRFWVGTMNEPLVTTPTNVGMVNLPCPCTRWRSLLSLQ